MKLFNSILCLFVFFATYSQNQQYNVATIPDNLIENANSVVRLNYKNIEIPSRKLMTITTKRVVTILNERGLESMDAAEYFSSSSKIKSIEAVILNKEGAEIKRIKRRDFKENSVSEGSVVTDNKLLFLDYTPIMFPFTLIFESVVETSNTAFIPSWYPIENRHQSVENSTYSINYQSELGFKYKEFNFENHPNISKEEKGNTLHFTAKNMSAIKNEEYAPSYQSFFPYVMFGLTTFHLEGVDGVASDWKNFGLWMYESLLKNTDEIPIETQNKVKNLVGNEKNPLEITKIIYKYVQDKTRYISIQLGIGGWKPMLAKDVDRLGYGDCKALTNFTRSLLQIVGVSSYYTVIYGDSDIRNLQEDFVSMQGNHVILGVPIDGKMYWLECTSQLNPFGFQGDFTDQRTALLIKPEGGEIVKTPESSANQNSQLSKGSFSIDAQGSLSGNVMIKSKGIQYENKFHIETKSQEELNKFYKNYFWHINNLKLQNVKLNNNKDAIEFKEEIAIVAPNFASLNSGRLMFSLNAFNPTKAVPQRYRTRMNPFEIARGFYDYDEIEINLPAEFVIEAKPEATEYKDKFGFYKTEYSIVTQNKLIYKRTYQVNPGYFKKEDYEDFRKFRESVAKMDNAKIVLIKKP
jgi:hypothetical protein